MNLNDILLIFSMFGSLVLAAFFPELGLGLEPLLIYFMMVLLFLSFLTLDFRSLLNASASSFAELLFWVLIKLAILPAGLYFLTLAIYPDYAIPVLLLSGISTGIVAPFMASLVSADIVSVLRMVVVTSLLVPFTLPFMVKLLAGSEIRIPLGAMIQLLAMVIFIPIGVVSILRSIAPGVLTWLERFRFSAQLFLIFVINVGVFSKYSAFFFQHPDQILVSILICYILSPIYYFAGFVVTIGRSVDDKLAAAISMAIINNVLVILFSSRFFGPLAPTLAAMYMFPFYTMIVPVKLFVRRRGR